MRDFDGLGVFRETLILMMSICDTKPKAYKMSIGNKWVEADTFGCQFHRIVCGHRETHLVH